MDHLHSVAFQGTALSRAVQGTQMSLPMISRSDLLEFKERHYVAPRLAITAVGDVDHDAVVEAASTAFRGLPDGPALQDYSPSRYTGSDVRIRDDEMSHAHVMVAVEGAPWTSPDVLALQVAQTLVGAFDRTLMCGEHVHSQTARAMAEQDLADAYTSFSTSYSDTGLWGIYFTSADPMNLDDVMYVIQKEWIRLCTDATESEVARARERLKTNLLARLNCQSTTCTDVGQQLFGLGRRMSPLELSQRIDAVDAKTLRSVMMRYVYDRCPVIAAWGAVEGLTDYNRFRSSMSSILF